jgi:hypothetical protein
MADLECFFEKNGLGPLGVKEKTILPYSVVKVSKNYFKK